VELKAWSQELAVEGWFYKIVMLGDEATVSKTWRTKTWRRWHRTIEITTPILLFPTNTSSLVIISLAVQRIHSIIPNNTLVVYEAKNHANFNSIKVLNSNKASYNIIQNNC